MNSERQTLNLTFECPPVDVAPSTSLSPSSPLSRHPLRVGRRSLVPRALDRCFGGARHVLARTAPWHRRDGGWGRGGERRGGARGGWSKVAPVPCQPVSGSKCFEAVVGLGIVPYAVAWVKINTCSMDAWGSFVIRRTWRKHNFYRGLNQWQPAQAQF